MVSVLAAGPLVVSGEQREALELMARSSSLSYRTVVQAKALLLAADGVSIYETARRLDVTSNSCGRGGAASRPSASPGWAGSPRAGAGGRGWSRRSRRRWCRTPCTPVLMTD